MVPHPPRASTSTPSRWSTVRPLEEIPSGELSPINEGSSELSELTDRDADGSDYEDELKTVQLASSPPSTPLPAPERSPMPVLFQPALKERLRKRSESSTPSQSSRADGGMQALAKQLRRPRSAAEPSSQSGNRSKHAASWAYASGAGVEPKPEPGEGPSLLDSTGAPPDPALLACLTATVAAFDALAATSPNGPSQLTLTIGTAPITINIPPGRTQAEATKFFVYQSIARAGFAHPSDWETDALVRLAKLEQPLAQAVDMAQSKKEADRFLSALHQWPDTPTLPASSPPPPPKRKRRAGAAGPRPAPKARRSRNASVRDAESLAGGTTAHETDREVGDDESGDSDWGGAGAGELVPVAGAGPSGTRRSARLR